MTHASDPIPALHVGNIRAVLATMPDTSAGPILTSPPDWAHRDYTVADQYGHESSSAASGETLRLVFREARRVLANGTCWLNLADSSHKDSQRQRTSHRPARLPRPRPDRVARLEHHGKEPASVILAGRVRAGRDDLPRDWVGPVGRVDVWGEGTGTFCVSGAVVLACAQPACVLLGIDHARTVVVA
jgi:hypothetical protein